MSFIVVPSQFLPSVTQPANLCVKGNELTWEPEADLESGLAGFIIERDGQFLLSSSN